MGNQCCCQCQTSSTQASLINLQSSKNPNFIHKQPHVDNQGVPVPNAYKRYVKPPTTVGRQSVVVRDLHENEDIPDWIWATQNRNILNSGTKSNSSNNQPFNRPFAHNRHTYQPIEGRFKGVETVNLSKLQNKPLTSSENSKPRIYSASNPINGQYSAQPNAFVNNSELNYLNTTKSVTNPLNQPAILTSNGQSPFSIHGVPVVTSINVNKNDNQVEMKMTESKSIPMSPFQMITHGQNDRNSNFPSVNNSIQRPNRY